MGAGTKILAGCGCAAIGALVVVLAGVGLGAYWLKDRVAGMAGGLEGLTATSREIDDWERRANAHPYEKPADGIIPEPRLVAFLDVRREVHDVYLDYETDLQALQESAEEGDVAELLRLGARAAGMFGDLRLAQLKALARAGMPEKEYYAIQTAVYMAAGAWETTDRTGTLPAEAVEETARKVREAMKAGIARAREEGVPGSEHLTDAELEKLEETLSRIGTTGAGALSVPAANVALFRKHEDAIRKYAMHGLAVLGL